MKIIITESQSAFLKRRLNQINHLVSLALDRVDPREYILYDYIEEIAWHVADSFESNFDASEILDFIKNNYRDKIAQYYSNNLE